MAAALERALGPAGCEAAAGPEVPVAGPQVPVPVLVLGPAGSGRTALLLRAALAGGADGPRALFLAPSAVPRLPSSGGGTDPRALQRLELRYPPSRGSLTRELGALAPRPPDLLLLDGLERYLGGSLVSCARLAALLLETTQPRDPLRDPPHVVAALRLPPPAPYVLPTLRRYFPAECRLRPRPGGLVRVRLSRPGAPTRRWRLRFDPHGGLRVGPGDGDGDEEEEEEEEDGDSDGEEECG